MVGFTQILCRIPVIKFRKGGLGHAAGPAPSAAPAAAQSAAAPAPASASVRAAAAMSTSAMSDLDLPARYKRLPLSQEEIDHINGGGIV